MSKNPMQDIVPKGKSIRNVPVPETRARTTVRSDDVKRRRAIERIEEDDVPVRLNKMVERRPRIAPVIEETIEEVQQEEPVEESTVDKEVLRSVRREFENKPSSSRRTRPKTGKNKKRLMLLGLFVGVVLLAVLVSGFFGGASVTITPRTDEASILNEYSARKGDAATGLSYETVSVTSQGSESIKATGERQVERRATGIIIIYNNYSTTAQRLIKNTRFSTPEGLIFRISDSVNVPGKKGTTPGSIEATVTADEPGEKYNVGLRDFTIPGFKGDPRYTSFYARSKTPLAGGFSGVEKIVAESDREKAKANIRKKIESDLISQIAAQIPADSVGFKNGWEIEYKSLPEQTVSDTEVKIQEEGTLTSVVFDRKQLSSTLAESKITEYNGEPILVTNLEDLAFVVKEPFSPASADSIFFSLTGGAEFEWLYDEASLKESLAGEPRSAIPSVLQKFPMIQKADISLRPLWARKFPSSPEKINVQKGL
jgi:nitrogen fixation protein